ncbi:uncharacterized protein LOC131892334 [Tigriopus californicus]|uniref:uncharacterized protein LOC131892334 n=1 Tax=Tigriopus californicus TaxID=6832 RepID=UPI0027D9DD91|nr:uncharacterized protein LOC131892334 [Tigriopus californicus]
MSKLQAEEDLLEKEKVLQGLRSRSIMPKSATKRTFNVAFLASSAEDDEELGASKSAFTSFPKRVLYGHPSNQMTSRFESQRLDESHECSLISSTNSSPYSIPRILDHSPMTVMSQPLAQAHISTSASTQITPPSHSSHLSLGSSTIPIFKRLLGFSDFGFSDFTSTNRRFLGSSSFHPPVPTPSTEMSPVEVLSRGFMVPSGGVRGLPLGLSGASNTCAKCGITFRMTSDLVYHMRTHHNRLETKERDSIQSQRRESEPLRCVVCGEDFKERHHLTRHMTAHQDKAKSTQPESKAKVAPSPSPCPSPSSSSLLLPSRSLPMKSGGLDGSFFGTF